MASVESLFVSAPTRRLGLYEEPDADRDVVVLRGEYDVSTASALSATLAAAIARDGTDVVVDMSGVEFIDAATVGVIIRGREFLQERSRSLTLRSPAPCARRVLDLCGVPDVASATATARALRRWAQVPAAGP
jgi:anti-sigma B factor antagonist